MLNDDPRPRRPGLLVCRHTQPFPMNLVNGLRVTTAAETILSAARDLGVLDLVILGDSALRLRHCTLTDLQITARQRRRGAPLLRRLIPLLDARSESPWESIMRVLHQAAEIPVTPQYEIFDQRGRFSPSVGSGTASPQNTSGETAPRSSPTPIACSGGRGIRIDSRRGRACSTTRSSDEPVEPAPIATGSGP